MGATATLTSDGGSRGLMQARGRDLSLCACLQQLPLADIAWRISGSTDIMRTHTTSWFQNIEDHWDTPICIPKVHPICILTVPISPNRGGTQAYTGIKLTAGDSISSSTRPEGNTSTSTPASAHSRMMGCSMVVNTIVGRGSRGLPAKEGSSCQNEKYIYRTEIILRIKMGRTTKQKLPWVCPKDHRKGGAFNTYVCFLLILGRKM